MRFFSLLVRIACTLGASHKTVDCPCRIGPSFSIVRNVNSSASRPLAYCMNTLFLAFRIFRPPVSFMILSIMARVSDSGRTMLLSSSRACNVRAKARRMFLLLCPSPAILFYPPAIIIPYSGFVRKFILVLVRIFLLTGLFPIAYS